jgi:hypothetical protein
MKAIKETSAAIREVLEQLERERDRLGRIPTPSSEVAREMHAATVRLDEERIRLQRMRADVADDLRVLEAMRVSIRHRNWAQRMVARLFKLDAL